VNKDKNYLAVNSPFFFMFIYPANKYDESKTKEERLKSVILSYLFEFIIIISKKNELYFLRLYAIIVIMYFWVI